MTIPKQLQKPEFRFVKVIKGTKIDSEINWPNLVYNHEDAERFLQEGHDYGVMGWHGNLVIIDCDTDKIINSVKNNLPKTFVVTTGSEKKHYYFICKGIDKYKEKKIILSGVAGQITLSGSYVVGAGSLHPNGKTYKVLPEDNIEIAEISTEQLFEALHDFIKKTKLPQYDSESKGSIEEILKIYGWQESGKRNNNEIYGSHPIHGSENGQNFSVNPQDGIWHCFRCNSGGGFINLIAVLERVISCDKAIKGGLRGDLFKRTCLIAKEKYGVEITQIKKGVRAPQTEADTGMPDSSPEEPLVDVSQFKPLSSKELVEILGLTIKQDEDNKIVTFLCELSAYTENAQFNISYNAPSSTGKSYIPTEIARLFPEKDLLELAYCSPTAFFHDVGEWNKDMKGYVVDLSRKILIFLDQPHTQLLERLRPLLSHDKKEISVKITDKTQKFGMKTKNILLKGYPAVIFCTAGLRIDEQEATRFLLLSPEVNHEKIRQGILESIKKEADAESYKSWLDENPERKLLKERIRAIKLEGIREIKIASHQKVIDRFLTENKVLKPRHQRDIKRLSSLIKSLALINLWWREKNGTTITANEDDIEQAFKIWDAISVSQELNLPPYIYNLYQEVILKAWNEKNSNRSEGFEEITGKLGLSRQEVLQRHFEVYGRMLDTNQLRQQILPMLETAGLIMQETDQNDKRKMLIYPTALFTKSSNQNNSEMRGGVTPDLGVF